MVVHGFGPSTWEAKAGGSLWVWGQSSLQSKLLISKFICLGQT